MWYLVKPIGRGYWPDRYRFEQGIVAGITHMVLADCQMPIIKRRISGDIRQLALIDQVLINLFQIPAFRRLIQTNYRY